MNLKNKKILTINSGSSSIKFALFNVEVLPKNKQYGKIDRIGLSHTTLSYHDLITGNNGTHNVDTASAVLFLIDWLNIILI